MVTRADAAARHLDAEHQRRQRGPGEHQAAQIERRARRLAHFLDVARDQDDARRCRSAR